MRMRWMLALFGAVAATSACSQTTMSDRPTTTTTVAAPAAVATAPAAVAPTPVAASPKAGLRPARLPPKISSAVAQDQQMLLNAGYSPGRIDGILGRQTRAAVKSFQTAKGLPVTGRFDPATQAALRAK